MRSLRVTLDPAGRRMHPLFRILADSAFVDGAWLLDSTSPNERTVTSLFRVEGDRERFVAALEDADVVREYKVLPVAEGECYVHLHKDVVGPERRLWRAFTQQRSRLVPPLEYGDGTVTCHVVGDAADLRAALSDLPDGVEATVERVAEFEGLATGSGDGDGGAAAGSPTLAGDAASVLTGRQREVVRAAVAVGYYEVPRAATAGDVAERLGCTASTASEHLRKAEARLVRALVGE